MEEFHDTMPDELALVDGKFITSTSAFTPTVCKGNGLHKCKSIFILPPFSTMGIELSISRKEIKASFGINTHENYFETEEWNSDDNSELLKQVVKLAHEEPFENSLIEIIKLVSKRFAALYE
jgi:hypothetical protein